RLPWPRRRIERAGHRLGAILRWSRTHHRALEPRCIDVEYDDWCEYFRAPIHYRRLSGKTESRRLPDRIRRCSSDCRVLGGGLLLFSAGRRTLSVHESRLWTIRRNSNWLADLAIADHSMLRSGKSVYHLS